MTAAVTLDFKNVLVIAVLALVVIVLAYRLLNRDSRIRKTRIGWFVERDRYPEPDDAWPKPEPPEQRTLPQWPDRDKTAELPPNDPPAD